MRNSDDYKHILQLLEHAAIPVESHAFGDRVWSITTATTPHVRILHDDYDGLVSIDAYEQPFGLKLDWYNYLRAYDLCAPTPEMTIHAVQAILAKRDVGAKPSRIKGEA